MALAATPLYAGEAACGASHASEVDEVKDASEGEKHDEIMLAVSVSSSECGARRLVASPIWTRRMPPFARTQSTVGSSALPLVASDRGGRRSGTVRGIVRGIVRGALLGAVGGVPVASLPACSTGVAGGLGWLLAVARRASSAAAASAA